MADFEPTCANKRWAVMHHFLSVLLSSRFVRATLRTTSTVQDYIVRHQPALCTTDLHFAPPTCIVHHGAQGGPMSMRSRGHSAYDSVVHNVHTNNGSQCSSVPPYFVVHNIALY